MKEKEDDTKGNQCSLCLTMFRERERFDMISNLEMRRKLERVGRYIKARSLT